MSEIWAATSKRDLQAVGLALDLTLRGQTTTTTPHSHAGIPPPHPTLTATSDYTTLTNIYHPRFTLRTLPARTESAGQTRPHWALRPPS